MKKAALLTVVAFTFFCLYTGVACAGPTQLGLAWFGTSGMAKRVSAGFEKGMKEPAPDVAIEYKKELASEEEFARVVAAWEKEKNGMVLLRSNAATWVP